MKKKVPLQVHEFMEPYLDKKGENFQTIEADGFMMKFIGIINYFGQHELL